MVVGAAAFFMLAGPVLVSDASADDRTTCAQGKGDEKAAACTRIIQDRRATAKTRAIAHKNRGDTYFGEPRPQSEVAAYRERVIADYSEAIRLDPEEAARSYFFDRASAYVNNGDYDRAIADYSEVIRINPTSYSADYSRAYAYNGRAWAYSNKGDYDRAIADFSEAIRLKPKLVVALFYGRGEVFRKKNDFNRAIADYSEAIRLDPKNDFLSDEVFVGRGDAYYNLKDYDRAIADYNNAIRLVPYSNAVDGRRAARLLKGDYESIIAEYSEIIRGQPRHAPAYLSRGIFQLYIGNPAKGLADISQATELKPKDAYNALWLDIVGRRNSVPSRLPQAISQIDMTVWPAPVIRMFLGQLTSAAVFAAADNPEPKKKNDQICEANYFSGELALRQGAKSEAIRLFRLAARDCPHNFLEWYAANAELKALGVMP